MKKTSYLLLIIIVGVIVGTVAYLQQQDRASSLQEIPTELATEKVLKLGNFKYNEELKDYEGNVFVKGYFSLTEITEEYFSELQLPEGWCKDDCPPYTHVTFNVLEAGNESFYDYLEKHAAKRFLGKTYAGLGCVKDDVISYTNRSDEFGYTEYALSKELSDAIISSSKENPLALELKRYPDSHPGGSVPVCYSVFTHINSVE